jgi:outer membrane lipoprotein-sorting protein
MDIERLFERIIRNIGDSETPDEEHRRQLRKQVLDAVESVEPSAPLISPYQKRTLIMNNSLIRWTTAAAVLLICVAMILIHTGSSPTAAWADVGKYLNQAKKLSFKMVVYQGNELRMEGQLSYFHEDRMRMETKDSIGIFDWSKGKFLTLAPQEKQAVAATLKDIEKFGQRQWLRNWLADLKKIIGSKEAKEIGGKSFENHSCKGWEVTNFEGTVTVWANEKTAELVRVEIITGIVRTVMSEFNFNPQLDESQFSLEVPKGYEMIAETTFSGKDASDDDIVLLLRVWSGGNGNVFPDSLFDVPDWFKAASKYDWSKEKQDEDTLKRSINRAFFKLNTQQDWIYRGKGVKRGDAKQAIFWSPLGKDKFLVIHGDLSIRQVSKKELPKSQSSQ